MRFVRKKILFCLYFSKVTKKYNKTTKKCFDIRNVANRDLLPGCNYGLIKDELLIIINPALFSEKQITDVLENKGHSFYFKTMLNSDNREILWSNTLINYVDIEHLIKWISVLYSLLNQKD